MNREKTIALLLSSTLLFLPHVTHAGWLVNSELLPNAAKTLKTPISLPMISSDDGHKVITISVATCPFIEKEVSASEYKDYKEERSCAVPLPAGATITRVTAFVSPDTVPGTEGGGDLRSRMLDGPNSTARFTVVNDRIMDTAYAEEVVPCRFSGLNPTYMALYEGSKTFDCRTSTPTEENSVYYIRIETGAKARAEFRDLVLASKNTVFPMVRLIKVEYETSR